MYNDNLKIAVVGDPDQNIYSWRGSNIKHILDFDKNFPNVKTIILTKNYRSSPEILNLANDLIRNNKKRFKKNLESTMSNKELPIIYEIDSFNDEMTNVIKQIKTLKKENKINNFNDVMILYRNNSFSANLEREVIKEKIPYIIYGSFQFFERKEIKRIVNLLRILVSQDNFSFSNFLLTLPGIGLGTIGKLEEVAKNNNCSLFEIAMRNDLSTLIRKIPSEFNSYIQILKRFIIKVDNFNDPIEYLNDILTEFNIFKEYEEDLEPERIENIHAFFDMLSQFEAEYINLEGVELIYEFLLDLSLFQEKNNYVEKTKQEESLIISTIHKAKGLEAKVVFIIGVAEGILPSNKKNHQSDLLEEERRLLFVAMTRAKEFLYISFNKSFSFLIYNNFEESSFLKKLTKSNYVRVKIEMSKDAILENNKIFDNVAENSLISHSLFGVGKIIEVNEKYFLVNFNDKIKKVYRISSLWKKIKN